MASRKRTSHRGPGWDAIATPVPGNVLACLEELGVEILGQRGDEISGHCPMHFARLGKQDRHSSWSVNAEEGYFNCFSCGYKGAFIQLVMDMQDSSRSEAAAWIRARGGIERARRILERGKKGPESATDTTKQINEASLALFIDPPPEARSERHLRLSSCQDYGVLWDPERAMWIVPIRDPDHFRLIGWQEKNARYFRNRPYTMNKSTTLFGVEQFADTYAVLVESPLDVVRLDSVGVSGGLACMGSAPSAQQMQIVLNLTDTVIVAMDNPAVDSAGKRAAKTLQQNWARRGLTMRFFSYEGTDAKDIGEMTDAQIRAGIDNATSSIRARF